MCPPVKFLFCFGITISITFLICCSPSSILSFFNLISSFLILAISFLSCLVFKGLAYLLVCLIQACQAPAQGLHDGLCWAADGLRSLANSLLDKALEAAAMAASLVIDFLKELAPKIAIMVYEAFTSTMEYAKAGIECLQKVVPEIMKFLGDMVMKVAECLWSNYLEAMKYIIETGK